MQETNTLNIREIVDKAQKYDKEAFSMIFDMYYDQIYKYSYFRVGNRQDAEDITQNTFIAVLNSVGKFTWNKSDNDFAAWLFTIVHNKIADFFRKNSSKPHFQPIEDSQLSDLNLLPGIIERSYTLNELKKVLHCIPQKQQQVLILRFINDFSIKKTAEIMKKNEGAVKSLQLRALTSLKKIMGDQL